MKLKFTKEEVVAIRDCILNEGNSKWMLLEGEILYPFSNDNELELEVNHYEFEALLKVTQYYVVPNRKESREIKNQIHLNLLTLFNKYHSQ